MRDIHASSLHEASSLGGGFQSGSLGRDPNRVFILLLQTKFFARVTQEHKISAFKHNNLHAWHYTFQWAGVKLCLCLQMAQFPICFCLGSYDNRYKRAFFFLYDCKVIPSFTSPQLKPPPKELMQIKVKGVLMDFSPQNTPKPHSAMVSEEWVSNKEDRACQEWGLGIN